MIKLRIELDDQIIVKKKGDRIEDFESIWESVKLKLKGK